MKTTRLLFAPAPQLYPMPVLGVDWHQSVAVTSTRVVRRNHSAMVVHDGRAIGWYRRCRPEEDPR